MGCFKANNWIPKNHMQLTSKASLVFGTAPHISSVLLPNVELRGERVYQQRGNVDG